MRRCFRSFSGAVLIIAVLGSLLQPLAAEADDKGRWTSTAGVPEPQGHYFESTRVISGDQTRLFRWIPESKSPSPFGYSLTVTSSAKDGQGACREPIALLSPDLAYLAIRSDTGGVQLIDRTKKQKTSSMLLTRQIMKGQPDAAKGVQDLAFYRSAEKMTLVVADGSKELTLCDAAQGNQLASLAHDQAGDRIAFAPGRLARRILCSSPLDRDSANAISP